MRKSILSILVIVGLLAACGTPIRTINTNSEGVSFSYDGSKEDLKTITRLAMNECQKVGRVAVLKDSTELDDVYVANFECRRANI